MSKYIRIEKFLKEAFFELGYNQHQMDVISNKIASKIEKEASFKNLIKNGIKKFVNADDFKRFSKAYRRGDKSAMKKALPGMIKGIAKVVGTIAAVAGLGYVAKHTLLKETLDHVNKETGIKVDSFIDKPNEIIDNIPKVKMKLDDIVLEHLKDTRPIEKIEEEHRITEQFNQMRKIWDINDAFRKVNDALHDVENSLDKVEKDINLELKNLYEMAKLNLDTTKQEGILNKLRLYRDILLSDHLSIAKKLLQYKKDMESIK